MSRIDTPEFRVSYPTVFKTRYNKLAKKDEYSIQALFPLGDPLTKLKDAALKAIEAKWGTNRDDWPKGMRSPFKDQANFEQEREDGTKFMPDGYVKGAIYMDFRSTERPGVVDKDVVAIKDTSEFYGGCYAVATLSCYAYEAGENKGVNFGLGNIQKVRDGKPFGNRTKAEDDFKPVKGPVDAGGSTSNAGDLFN